MIKAQWLGTKPAPFKTSRTNEVSVVQAMQHSHDSNDNQADLPVERAATLGRHRPPAAIRCRTTVFKR
jgi:hypothetical protein